MAGLASVTKAEFNVGSWPSGLRAYLDCRKVPFWIMQHRMYNVQIVDHFNYKYRFIITRTVLIYLVMKPAI